MQHKMIKSAARMALIGLVSGLGAVIGAAPANATVLNYTVTLNELNNSGVSGGGTLTFDDATNMLTVDYTVTGLADGVHPQHIHGLFDGGIGVPGGTHANSTTPTLANDTDGDGIIEVSEGAATYGDILLSLSETPGAGDFPTTAGGTLNYNETFNLGDSSVFTPSAATGNVYSMADLFPLTDREIVIHGAFLTADDGLDINGQPTGGEADGTAGYKDLLPVAAGTIEAAQAVPEPGMLSILGIGLFGLMIASRKRRHAAIA